MWTSYDDCGGRLRDRTGDGDGVQRRRRRRRDEYPPRGSFARAVGRPRMIDGHRAEVAVTTTTSGPQITASIVSGPSRFGTVFVMSARIGGHVAPAAAGAVDTMLSSVRIHGTASPPTVADRAMTGAADVFNLRHRSNVTLLSLWR